MLCCATTDLLHKGGVWYTPPVEIFVQLYWYGYWFAWSKRVDRMTEMKKKEVGEHEEDNNNNNKYSYYDRNSLLQQQQQ